MIYSQFFNPTTSIQTEKKTSDLVKLDQETTGMLNDKLMDKNRCQLNFVGIPGSLSR